MSEAIEQSEGLDTSLGYGVVAMTDCIARYVVVEPDSPLLPKESPVGKSEYGALVVSASLPTKPESHRPDLPTQSEAVRKFISEEQRAKGQEPNERPTQLTPAQVLEGLTSDIAA